MYFDDTAYVLHNSGDAWSFKQTDDVYRFEVRSGDQWRERDGTKERSEISAKETLNFDHTYTLTYDFMIEPGQKITSDWLNIGQFHGSPDVGDYGSLGPVFATQMRGEQMRFITRTDPDRITESRPEDNVLYTDSAAIVRGHWYQMKIDIRFDADGQGLIKVWRDGDLLVNYTGGVGYNDAVGPYWKMGIYREASPETLAINYRNFDITEGGATTQPPLTSPETPTSDPSDALVQRAPSNQPALLQGAGGDDRLVGAGGADTLDGGGGADLLTAGGGNDTLDGGAGSDTLQGGAGDDLIRGGDGADLLKGNDGGDTLNGGAGADTLTGGSGYDVFRFGNRDGSVDVITDFSKSDKVQLALSDFGVSGGQAQFVNGMAATANGAPALHYTASTGALYLDLDGGDVGNAVQLATLSNHIALSADSFVFI
ncbi:heparin lyase I family protein [Phenylobacterium sp.]|uniref:heparin lyase I family protein n=1 Tax=Phenylobacterium sp. TaxID=1871053 RepID=UPI003784CE5E